MSSKPSYLALEDKVKALEAELALRDQEDRKPPTTRLNREAGSEAGTTDLEEVNRRLEQELAVCRKNHKTLQWNYDLLETLVNIIR